MRLKFLLLRKSQKLGSQFHPSANCFPCRSNIDMHLVRLFQILFGQPQTRFNYRQEIPEIVDNPTRHFPEGRKPLCGPRGLLCRGSLPESHIK
jgi:hypothetical protein